MLVVKVSESPCLHHQTPQCLYQPEPKPPCVLPRPLPRLVREFVAQNNTSQIKHVIQILSQEFALSQHPHSRKGGLIGLAACSIALGKVGVVGFLACAGCGERTAAPLGPVGRKSQAGGPAAPSLHCSLQLPCVGVSPAHSATHPLGPGALSGLG